MESVLADLLSGASDRVLTASSLVNHTRDIQLLKTLAAALPKIRWATWRLNLGGMLVPNHEHLRQAFRVIENHRAGRCFCQIYPGYLFYDPEEEQDAGHVRVTRSDPPNWSMTYDCVCTVCGRAYAVKQGEYHYTWWEWHLIEMAGNS